LEVFIEKDQADRKDYCEKNHTLIGKIALRWICRMDRASRKREIYNKEPTDQPRTVKIRWKKARN